MGGRVDARWHIILVIVFCPWNEQPLGRTGQALATMAIGFDALGGELDPSLILIDHGNQPR